MRIVDRATFLAMLPGTVYSKYQPCVFEGLCIKGDSLTVDGKPIDWFYVSMEDAIDVRDSGEWMDKLESARCDGASVPMDFDIESRDGCFDDDQLFGVFEPADVIALVKRLTRILCLPLSGPKKSPA